jgi:hypothetical protein
MIKEGMMDLPITEVMSRRTGESIREDDATYWVVTGILEEQGLLVTLKMDEGMHGDQYTDKENIV